MKDETEQRFSKRVLGVLSFSEMIQFTELQNIKLIKTEQLRWKARRGTHQFPCSWPRSDHSVLTDMERPSFGDRKGHPAIHFQKEGTGLVIHLVAEQFEGLMDHLGGTIQRWSLQVWSFRKRAPLESSGLRWLFGGITCLLSHLCQCTQDWQGQERRQLRNEF